MYKTAVPSVHASNVPIVGRPGSYGGTREANVRTRPSLMGVSSPATCRCLRCMGMFDRLLVATAYRTRGPLALPGV